MFMTRLTKSQQIVCYLMGSFRKVFGKAMCKCLLTFIVSALLSGCYSKWQELESYAGEISCGDSRTKIIQRAAVYQADVLIDDDSQSIQVSKGEETVVVQFDRNNNITQVSVFQIKVQFFGLHRRQLTPYILLNCYAKNRSSYPAR